MIYAMSDFHGCLGAFEARLAQVDLEKDNRLILLGDYINYGPDSGGVLARVRAMQETYGTDKVIALMGNHEADLLEQIDLHKNKLPPQTDASISALLNKQPDLIRWLKKLPLYYKTDTQIFVHAGIDEEAEDWWETGTPDFVFTGKYPATTGPFYMTVIAGHVGTHALARKKAFHDIFFDGESHYYIDGTVYDGGQLNLLLYDEETACYYSVDAAGKPVEIRKVRH